jgi:hypothetical protein
METPDSGTTDSLRSTNRRYTCLCAWLHASTWTVLSAAQLSRLEVCRRFFKVGDRQGKRRKRTGNLPTPPQRQVLFAALADVTSNACRALALKRSELHEAARSKPTSFEAAVAWSWYGNRMVRLLENGALKMSVTQRLQLPRANPVYLASHAGLARNDAIISRIRQT